MIRNEHLRRVVAVAKNHPLYQERLGGLDAGALTPEMLSKVAPITRNEWIAHIQAHPEPPAGTRLVHLTPSPALGWMPEYLSQEDIESQAGALAAHLKTLGLEGKRAIVTFGYHVFAGGWLFHEALQKAGVAVLPHGPGEAERVAQLQKKYRYQVLVSNPTFALKIAEAGGRFELLIGAGEPFTSVPGYREKVESALSCTALDFYGTSELGVIAAEDQSKAGLVEISEMALLEVLDPETLRPVADGEKGELVVTALTRTLMPMIRFRTGDLAIAEHRNGQLVLPKGVFGRTDTMVKVKGIKLYPTELGPIVSSFGIDGRSGYQVIVESGSGGTDKLSIRVKLKAVPEGLAEAVKKATGLKVDGLEAVSSLEGPVLVDHRFK